MSALIAQVVVVVVGDQRESLKVFNNGRFVVVIFVGHHLVQLGRLVGFAVVFVLPLRARLALDRAAPLEGALARLRYEDAPGIVAAPAAEQIAAVDPFGSFIARPSGSTDGSRHGIVGTIVGRVFQVDQVVKVGRLSLVTLSVVIGVVRFDERRAGRIAAHLGRSVVALLQVVAHFSEFRQSGPAGADVAGSRHSVAFALVTDEFVNGLATHSVVVQVHQRPRVPHLPLTGVHKLTGEMASVTDVGRAAAPNEIALLVLMFALEKQLENVDATSF